MPGFRFHSLLSFILVTLYGATWLGAEEPARFVDEPVVSFVSDDSSQGVSRHRSQLHGFRDALTNRQPPQAVEYPTPPAPIAPPLPSVAPERQVITAELRTEQSEPEVRQTAMAEPLPMVAATPSLQIDSTADEETEDDPKDSVLGKTIGFSSKKSGMTGKLAKPEFANAIAPIISIIGSLLIVLSAFFILMMIFKKMSPKGNRMLPKEAFEDLGRTFLTPKLQLRLLRLGHRLILVSVTQDGVSPITEVTDPDEVVPLLGLCRQLDPNSSSELFRKIYSDLNEKDDLDEAPVKKPKKSVAVKASAKSNGLVDLYSEPDESLVDILASGLGTKGGRHGS